MSDRIFEDKDYYKNGYMGEEIHMLRNNVQLDLANFFNNPSGGVTKYCPSFLVITTSPFSYANNVVEDAYQSNPIFNTNSGYQYSEITVMFDGKIQATTYSTTSNANLNNLGVSVLFYDLDGKPLNKLIVRVYVHNDISSIWLTPNPLEIRADIDLAKVKYTVLAMFDSGIIGNISYHKLIWSTSLNYLNIDSDYGWITFNTTNPLPSIPKTETSCITVQMPTLLTGASTPIVQNIGISILEPLTTLDSNNVPKYYSLSKIHAATDTRSPFNILITADGFEAIPEIITTNNPTPDPLENKYLNTYCTDLVTNLSDAKFYPYVILKDTINIWRLSVPSGGHHGNHSDEYITVKIGATNDIVIQKSDYITKCVEFIPNWLGARNTIYGGNIAQYKTKEYVADEYKKKWQEKYPNHSDAMDWDALKDLNMTDADFDSYCTSQSALDKLVDLNFLVSIVGMPSPADNVSTVTLSTKIVEWRKIVSDLKAEGESGWMSSYHVLKFVFHQWKLMANRRYLNRKNTALGTYSGSRYNSKKCDIDIYSMSIGQINKLLSNLRDKNGSIGALFIDSNMNKVKGGGDNVIILSNSYPISGLAAVNNGYNTKGNKIVSPLLAKDIVEYSMIKSGDDAYTLALGIYPSKLDKEYYSKLIHELGHSLFLGDEYSSVNLDISTSLSSTDENQFNEFGNLVVKKKLLNPSNSNEILSNNIPWRNWPRIKKGGLLISTFNPNTTNTAGNTKTYTVDVAHGITNNDGGVDYKFLNGETVLLRNRDLNGLAGIYVKMTIDSISTNSTTKIDTFTLTCSNAFDPAQYINGVIMLPDWKDNSCTTMNMIMHDRIIERIDHFKKAFTEEDTIDNRLSLPKTEPNLGGKKDALKDVIRDSYKVVGVFSGGNGFYKGIYHPTGLCFMRNHSLVVEKSFDPLSNKYQSTEEYTNYYCPVCRYIIVDYVNPIMHPKNNESYKYPEFR